MLVAMQVVYIVCLLLFAVYLSVSIALLLQLAEFPGYNEHCPTPLPESLDSTNILQTVIRAQADLQRKVDRSCQVHKTYILEISFY